MCTIIGIQSFDMEDQMKFIQSKSAGIEDAKNGNS